MYYSTKGKNCFAAVSVRIVADLGGNVQIVIGFKATLAACPIQANSPIVGAQFIGRLIPLKDRSIN
jgi:hypothetical protein